MKALLICENLIKDITNEGRVWGRVHSVFKNACNINTDRHLITLLGREKVMAPMSVMVDDNVDFQKLGIARGSYFEFRQDEIKCNGQNILISLDDTPGWFPGVVSEFTYCAEQELLENIKIMELELNNYGKPYGISPLVGILITDIPGLYLSSLRICAPDKNYEFLRCGFIHFMQTVITGDMEKVADAAKGVIGFGPGLTPAMDDFICGMMIALIYLGNYYKMDTSLIYEFNGWLISQGLSRTTMISAEMLKHAALGETNQAVRELIQAILRRPGEGNIAKAMINTVALGETSGSDTAFGIYVGCKILANSRYRGEWSNVSVC